MKWGEGPADLNSKGPVVNKMWLSYKTHVYCVRAIIGEPALSGDSCVVLQPQNIYKYTNINVQNIQKLRQKRGGNVSSDWTHEVTNP